MCLFVCVCVKKIKEKSEIETYERQTAKEEKRKSTDGMNKRKRVSSEEEDAKY